MQLNKNIKIFINYFFGPLLFAWLAFSIYRQITAQPQLEASWLRIEHSFQSYRILSLVFALLLILLNWGLESLKWKISVEQVHPVSYLQAFKAVLSGVSFSVTMPNRVGEYLGRMMYLPEGSRLRTISVTLVGSFAQMLATLMAGTIGLLFLKKNLVQQFPILQTAFPYLLSGLIGGTIALLVFYFNVAGVVGWIKRWIRWEKYGYLVEALSHFHQSLLIRILALSLLRYLVFLLQYILVFYLFDVQVPAATICVVMSVIFLTMAVIPSISLVEVGLRGEISIRLMGMYSANTLGIGLTSVTLWFINLILPAIVGSVLLLNLRVFNRKNETS